VLYIHNFN